jgi:hypothetical protein
MIRDILLLWLLPLVSAGAPPAVAPPAVLCAFGPAVTSYDAHADEPPSADAMQLARQASAALVPFCSPTCPALAINRNATAPNAILLVESGRAKMAYAPAFFADVYTRYGDSAIVALIAHMLGHAMERVRPGDWIKAGSTPELAADAWTGCALARTQLSPRTLQDALEAQAKYPPASAPDWPQRVAALRLGYTHCGGAADQFDSRAAPLGR